MTKFSFQALFAVILLALGSLLTLVNLYGLTQTIRPAGLEQESLRFANDVSIHFDDAMAQIDRHPNEDKLNYAKRLTHLIAQSIAHIHWNETKDTRKYHQHIPIWENYFLYFMGRFSGIPEYQKYHYMDFERSLKRGIGVCGDTSMIMEQILEANGIESEILAFPGHVVIQANIDGKHHIFDADFGVYLPFEPTDTPQKIEQIVSLYTEKGYGQDEEVIRSIYTGLAQTFPDIQSFAFKKYYFENIAYFLKWPLPLAMLCLGLFILIRMHQET